MRNFSAWVHKYTAIAVAISMAQLVSCSDESVRLAPPPEAAVSLPVISVAYPLGAIELFTKPKEPSREFMEKNKKSLSESGLKGTKQIQVNFDQIAQLLKTGGTLVVAIPDRSVVTFSVPAPKGDIVSDGHDFVVVRHEDQSSYLFVSVHKTDRLITASIQVDGTEFSLRPDDSSAPSVINYYLHEKDPLNEPPRHPKGWTGKRDSQTGGRQNKSFESNLNLNIAQASEKAVTQITIKLLVVATSDSLLEGSVGDVSRFVRDSVSILNNALTQSDPTGNRHKVQFSLVTSVAPIAFNEANRNAAELLDAFDFQKTSNDPIDLARLRAQFKPDIIGVIVKGAGGLGSPGEPFGGAARINATSAGQAVFLLKSSLADDTALAHEIAHLVGADHDDLNAELGGTSGGFRSLVNAPYLGYVMADDFRFSAISRKHSIMAYARPACNAQFCTAGKFFSNPRQVARTRQYGTQTLVRATVGYEFPFAFGTCSSGSNVTFVECPYRGPDGLCGGSFPGNRLYRGGGVVSNYLASVFQTR